MTSTIDFQNLINEIAEHAENNQPNRTIIINKLEKCNLCKTVDCNYFQYTCMNCAIKNNAYEQCV